MARVETVADARGARGCSAASAYKMDVLLSWDMDCPEISSVSDAAAVCTAKLQAPLDERQAEASGKQIEISNGLLLHEVCAIIYTCFFLQMLTFALVHVELGAAVGCRRVAGILVHSATVRLFDEKSSFNIVNTK